MNTLTPRTDECLAGKGHGNAIEFLARELEQELSAMEVATQDLNAEVDRLTDVLHAISEETDHRNIKGTIQHALRQKPDSNRN